MQENSSGDLIFAWAIILVAALGAMLAGCWYQLISWNHLVFLIWATLIIVFPVGLSRAVLGRYWGHPQKKRLVIIHIGLSLILLLGGLLLTPMLPFDAAPKDRWGSLLYWSSFMIWVVGGANLCKEIYSLVLLRKEGQDRKAKV